MHTTSRLTLAAIAALVLVACDNPTAPAAVEPTTLRSRLDPEGLRVFSADSARSRHPGTWHVVRERGRS